MRVNKVGYPIAANDWEYNSPILGIEFEVHAGVNITIRDIVLPCARIYFWEHASCCVFARHSVPVTREQFVSDLRIVCRKLLRLGISRARWSLGSADGKLDLNKLWYDYLNMSQNASLNKREFEKCKGPCR